MCLLNVAADVWCLLGHEDQHAVGSDGVDDGIGEAVWVCLRVLVSEVQTLEQLCGLLLGPLCCLETQGHISGWGIKGYKDM